MSEAYLDLVNLASLRLGASVVAANDEFFGGKDRLIVEREPIWIEDKYTDRGKWMDGWETRRRREPGHDWSIVRLGARGIVAGVDVETTHFKGNYPEACAVDLCDLEGQPGVEALVQAPWVEALPASPLQGNAHNVFAIETSSPSTHLRLRIFPDGGVARIRVYGEVVPDWARLRQVGQVDLAGIEQGGLVVGCSDMFFGSRQNLIMPGDARSMSEGWETRRRRGEGHDWAVVRLGTTGTIERAEVDTRHFKGNAPGWCSLESCGSTDWEGAGVAWSEILPRTRLQPDARHMFDSALARTEGVTHVRFNIYPDGGVARLRLFGRPA